MNASVSPIIYAPGRGTVGFNPSGVCFGRLRVEGAEIALRGSYDSTIVRLEGGGHRVVLTPANPTAGGNGPAMRGVWVDPNGESHEVSLWRPKNDGAKAYGLSDDEAFTPSEMVTPF